jgi:4-amino-4-deoxy-L-arabinose transferase-like glycosyltransferase
VGNRRTADRSSRAAARAPDAAVATAESGLTPLTIGALLAFVALALFHLAMCYDLFGFTSRRPDDPEMLRRMALLLLVSPDRLFEMWCGDKLEYFSLSGRGPVVLAAIAIVLAAWSAGRLLLDVLGITRLFTQLEQGVFAIAAGLNLLSLYGLVVGLFGGLHLRWLFVTPLVALLAYGGVRVWLDWWQASAVSWIAASDRTNRRWLWWLLAIGPYAAVMILGAMLPPYEYDVREYHLQVPKEWFQQGRITFLPHNIYGNMPLGSELTALWGMALIGGDDAWWWGAIVGKTVMACYSLVTIAGLIAFGRRVHSLGAGMIAAVVYASTPWIAHVSLVGYNEGPTALYFLCAIYAVWLAWKNEQPADSYRLNALAGFLAGAAVACKYPPALFLVVPLGGWVAVSPFLRAATAHSRTRIAIAALSLAVFAAGVAAGCGPWLAKNWALSGNPTYPLLYSVFDGQTRTPEKDQQWRRVHSPQPDVQGRRFTLAQLGVQAAWNLWRAKGASVILIPLVLAAWLAREQRGLVAVLHLWLLFVLVCWWLLTHRLDRFLVPLLPLLALLAGIGALALPQVAWQRATLGLVVIGAVVQFPMAGLFVGDHRYFVPLDALRRDDPRYAENMGPRVDISHRWLNAHVPAGKRVLLVGDAEPFDLQMPAIYNTCFDDCQFARIFQGRTREERLAALRAEGISHIFFSWSHLARYRSPGNYGYTSEYVTRDLVHRELVAEQSLLRQVNVNPAEFGLPADRQLDPTLGEIFEVVER